MHPNPQLVAALSPEPGAPALSAHAPAFPGVHLGVPPITVARWHQPGLCLFWSQSLSLPVSRPAPFGKCPGSAGSPCSSSLPDYQNVASSSPESLALQHLRSHPSDEVSGVACLFFPSSGCALGLLLGEPPTQRQWSTAVSLLVANC